MRLDRQDPTAERSDIVHIAGSLARPRAQFKHHRILWLTIGAELDGKVAHAGSHLLPATVLVASSFPYPGRWIGSYMTLEHVNAEEGFQFLVPPTTDRQ